MCNTFTVSWTLLVLFMLLRLSSTAPIEDIEIESSKNNVLESEKIELDPEETPYDNSRNVGQDGDKSSENDSSDENHSEDSNGNDSSSSQQSRPTVNQDEFSERRMQYGGSNAFRNQLSQTDQQLTYNPYMPIKAIPQLRRLQFADGYEQRPMVPNTNQYGVGMQQNGGMYQRPVFNTGSDQYNALNQPMGAGQSGGRPMPFNNGGMNRNVGFQYQPYNMGQNSANINAPNSGSFQQRPMYTLPASNQLGSMPTNLQPNNFNMPQNNNPGAYARPYDAMNPVANQSPSMPLVNTNWNRQINGNPPVENQQSSTQTEPRLQPNMPQAQPDVLRSESSTPEPDIPSPESDTPEPHTDENKDADRVTSDEVDPAGGEALEDSADIQPGDMIDNPFDMKSIEQDHNAKVFVSNEPGEDSDFKHNGDRQAVEDESDQDLDNKPNEDEPNEDEPNEDEPSKSELNEDERNDGDESIEYEANGDEVSKGPNDGDESIEDGANLRDGPNDGDESIEDKVNGDEPNRDMPNEDGPNEEEVNGDESIEDEANGNHGDEPEANGDELDEDAILKHYDEMAERISSRL